MVYKYSKQIGEISVTCCRVGTVGGVTKLHPSAMACLYLFGSPTAARLSAIIAECWFSNKMLPAIQGLGM